MKKLLLAAIIMSAALTANAQSQKPTRVVKGSVTRIEANSRMQKKDAAEKACKKQECGKECSNQGCAKDKNCDAQTAATGNAQKNCGCKPTTRYDKDMKARNDSRNHTGNFSGNSGHRDGSNRSGNNAHNR